MLFRSRRFSESFNCRIRGERCHRVASVQHPSAKPVVCCVRQCVKSVNRRAQGMRHRTDAAYRADRRSDSDADQGVRIRQCTAAISCAHVALLVEARSPPSKHETKSPPEIKFQEGRLPVWLSRLAAVAITSFDHLAWKNGRLVGCRSALDARMNYLKFSDGAQSTFLGKQG